MTICPICNRSFTPRTAGHSICGLVCFVAMKKEKEYARNSPATGSHRSLQVGMIKVQKMADSDRSHPPVQRKLGGG